MNITIQRCAIYTRKSSDEGLEQEFNSLHAQREACEAYITSQRHEGWRAVDAEYDDGGLSGGTMERPALKRLLSDIEAGLIDTIVVYKVDRLTRSLPDFAKMVEVFDAHSVSFVSVTQSFNTTSSMGRLTLNVLLSFAQFEREVTAERIRDKIAASRKKGMWMGGAVPLGYVARDKALHVEGQAAELVRLIYRRYASLGSVRAVQTELADERINDLCMDQSPTPAPGFSHGALYWILRNPVYCGDVRHKEEIHPGRHEPIIPREEWNAVQRLLDAQAGGPRASARRKAKRMLDGLLIDQEGRLLKTSFAVRSVKTKEGPIKKRYWYYQAQRTSRTDDGPGNANARGVHRIPAGEIERIIVETILSHLSDRSWIAAAMTAAGYAAGHLAECLERAADVAERLNGLGNAEDLETATFMATILDRAQLGSDSLTLKLQPGCLAVHDGDSLQGLDLPEMTVALHMRQFGRNKPIVISTEFGKANRDPDLIAMIADARRWLKALRSGTGPSVDALTQSEGKANGVISRMLPLAFLAPDITDAILAGDQPRSLTATRLREIRTISADWQEQRDLLGFDPR